MEQNIGEKVSARIQGFKLPGYDQIPDVGLYLEQTVRFIDDRLAPLPNVSITNSMVSNYVKKGLIANPVKKQYSRDQIAYLIFIAMAKNVLSLDALTGFIALQQKTYPMEKAYNYFAASFEQLLQYTFELTDSMKDVGHDTSDEKRLLYTCIVAVVQKVYLEKCLKAIAEAEQA